MNEKRREKRTGKIAVLLLITVLAVTCIPTLPYERDTSASGVYAEATEMADMSEDVISMSESDTAWYHDNPDATLFTLKNEEDLQGLADIVNSGDDNFSGDTVVMDENLIIRDFEIDPIGSEDHPFAGTFDGSADNNTILSDIKITSDRNSYIGLFGYTAPESVIKNIEIGSGNLVVREDNKNGSQIRYVGAIAGYAGGNIIACDSSMNITVTSKLTLGNHQGIIRNIGGITGHSMGNINDCNSYGDISISSDSDVNTERRYLIGEVGGITGSQGNVEDPTTLPVIEKCNNSGEIVFTVTGSGGVDRFGARLYSVSFSVGGIAGQTSGIVKECNNSGDLNTSNNQYGEPEAGRGAANLGGIVGNLRKDTFEYAGSSTAQNANFSKEDSAYIYYKNNGGAGNAPDSFPKTAGIYDCTNNANVIGLNAVGGILGNGGSFTEIEGCANINPETEVVGCRWNKPFAAGIAGTIQGDIRYCYNRSDIRSHTGGGYYCAGIAGGLWVAHEPTAEDDFKAPVTEMTGCYTTGDIFTDAPGYKTGILAGENEGFIHDNVYSASIMTKDNKLVDSDTGTIITETNTKLSAQDMKGSRSISLLNAYASIKGKWKILYLPSDSTNSSYPVLSRGEKSLEDAVQIPSGNASVDDFVPYSASSEPIPRISVALDDNEKLTQNADYYVIPEADAKEVSIGLPDEKPYTATIYGMGKYKGEFSQTVKYGIKKGDIDNCTIIANPTIFNWEVQRVTSEDVRLVDSAGEEIHKNDYTVEDFYDPEKGTKGYDIDPSPNRTDIRYYDYTNCHGANYKYDVKVTATESSNYEGSTIQQAFKINWASMSAYDPDNQTTKPDSVHYGDVVWQGKTWPFLKALKDTSGNTIQIPYTGKPITPTVTSAIYKGKELRLATNYDYQLYPLNYDYKYLYGNPNPENSGGSSYEPTNVTLGGSPTCMTIRYTNGGNFDNYVNVFFHIVPADIKAFSATLADRQYTGNAQTPKPVITWNKKRLTEGKDYTLSSLSYSSNRAVGKARVSFAVNGKGNYKGIYKKTITYKINPKKTKVKKLITGKRKMKVTFAKLSKKQKVTHYQTRYRVKGKSKWKIKTINAKKSAFIVKKLKKGKKYQVQVRAVKKIKKGQSKGSFCGAWSKTKTSKKIK